MDTAQVFKTGRSQAVRLPKEYRFTDTEVTVQHFPAEFYCSQKIVCLRPFQPLWLALSLDFKLIANSRHSKIVRRSCLDFARYKSLRLHH